MLVGRARNAMRQRKLDLGVVELLDVVAAAFAGVDLSHSNDLNTAVTGTMSGSHFGVQLIDRTGQGGIAELLVHVMSSAAAVVAKPDSEVLYVRRLLLEDLVNGKNLTGRFLQFMHFVKKIPESALCRHRVRSKDPHTVYFRVLIGLRGDFTSDHLKIFLLYLRRE